MVTAFLALYSYTGWKNIINQTSHSQNLNITSWVIFSRLIMNFIADFLQLSLADMYNNGKTIPG